MLGPSVKLNKELWARVKKCAEAQGYSSPEGFVVHVLEKELARFETSKSDEEEVKRHLQGLGYID